MPPDAPPPVTATESRRLTSAERRAAVIKAAREVFCAEGLSGARMRAIAERAGISEPMLYRHFSSRDELYRVAVEDKLTALMDDAVAGARQIAARTDLERPAVIRALTSAYVQLMQEVAPLAAVALYEDHHRGKLLYQRVIRPGQLAAAEILYRAVTGRALRAGAENVLAVTLLGIPFGVALDGMVRGHSVDPDQMAERIATLFATPL